MVIWRLDLSYEGTPFHGWARQPGRRTVEGEMERALATVLRESVRLRVAGRTDAGVHALAQVASFATDAAIEPRRVRLSLNAVLPPEIAVSEISAARPGFDAREAASRTYRYRLWLPDARPVFERACVWDVRGAIDLESLVACASLLVGTRDFAALTPSARSYHTCVRQVLAAGWSLTLEGREAVFEITGSSFLHNMVRVAVGSMVDVAQGRSTTRQFEEGLRGGERRALGRTAPARGLALAGVTY